MPYQARTYFLIYPSFFLLYNGNIILRKKVKPMHRINNLKNHFENIVMTFNETNAYKVLQYLKEIPLLCDMDKKSKENRKLKSNDHKHLHPVSVGRGEIYNLEITEGIGSELSGNHLVIIIQNQKGNMYGEKVNELPIEGDGTKTNSNYQMALYNTDLISCSLNKNPSRIILTDIMTFDKARLKNKIATIKPEKMNAIDPKIKKQLSLK